MKSNFGPKLRTSIEIDKQKYRQPGETFYEKCTRIADSLKDSDEHFTKFRDILLDMRFLPAGRVQAAMGAAKQVTPYNCFVSSTIPDSMEGIMNVAKEAAETMRLGGGIGYDFSTIRPRNSNIKRTGSPASGPVSFMNIYDAVCKTVASAGNRRGAQMGVLRVDHPDIEEFVRSKQNRTALTQFNISVAVTDEFMTAVAEDKPFDLRFNGQVYNTISAKNLWNEIMRSTWDWAEPGILFIDKINNRNNLNYLEVISATNPCAEQPLPPNGACLLGSFNWVKYLVNHNGEWFFNVEQLTQDIPHVIRAMDNIVDRAIYPLEVQSKEAKNKRRMGIGVTGVANALEMFTGAYGSPDFNFVLDKLLSGFVNEIYAASAKLAKEKGVFPLYDKANFQKSYTYTHILSRYTRKLIDEYGLRNSHLTSIAPTGTISLMADNISSGIEPVFSHSMERTIQTYEGPIIEKLQDYAVANFDNYGKTAGDCTIDEHLSVLDISSKYMDSAVSKTINIGSKVTFEEFKDVYWKAYYSNAKGCTTFRADGKRLGILAVSAPEEGEGAACFYDPETGSKTCE